MFAVTIRLPPPEIQVSSLLVFFAPMNVKHMCATAHRKIRAYQMDHKSSVTPQIEVRVPGVFSRPMRSFPHQDEVKVRQGLHGAP